MPLYNEHNVSLKKPEMQHKRVEKTCGGENIQNKIIPENIDVIWYVIETKSGEEYIAQSLKFPLSEWSKEQAECFLKENEINYLSFEEAVDISNLKYANRIDDETAEIILYGDVGNEINGDFIAKEINELNSIGVKRINERINSRGGDIINGLSIVSANLNSKAEIHTYNDGVCASMAAIILVSGNKVFSADYATIMIHEPRIGMQTIKTTKDEKIKSALTALRDSVSNILQKRSSKSKSEIDLLLNQETWYNAKQAKREGFIDEVISYALKPIINNYMSVDEILSNVAAFYTQKNINKNNLIDNISISNNKISNDNLNEEKMKKEIIELLGIKSDKDSEILAEIKNLISKNTKNLISKNSEIDKLKNEIEQLKAEQIDKIELKSTNDELVEQISKLKEQILNSVIDHSVILGRFSEKDRKDLQEKFKNNIDGLKYINENVLETPPSIINQIKSFSNDDPRADWGFKEWSQKDPKKLSEIKNSNPKLYNELGRKSYGEKWTNV